MFYNLTLQRTTAINCAVVGHFTNSLEPDIILSRGKALEVLAIDAKSNKIKVLWSEDIFGEIVSMKSLRCIGTDKDLLVIGTALGALIILEYIDVQNMFIKKFERNFDLVNMPRKLPGLYLAVDPRGNAILFGAAAETRFMFIVKPVIKDSVISLMVHQIYEQLQEINSIFYDIIGLDSGHENIPTIHFACLGSKTKESISVGTEANHQILSIIELDLQTKNMNIKYEEYLEDHSNMLISVPSGYDGPGGLIICSENFISYKKHPYPAIHCPIPRRTNDYDNLQRNAIFICHATCITELDLFFLVQTELGDIFKVSLKQENDKVTAIQLKYFDTLPLASSICYLDNFLFVACEFGDHYLYKITSFGDNENEAVFQSSLLLPGGDTFFFLPRELRNLELVDVMESLSPIIDFQCANFCHDIAAKLYVACGRGSRSTLRMLQQGIKHSTKLFYNAEQSVQNTLVKEPSILPSEPTGVWMVKHELEDFETSNYYVVLSYDKSTDIFHLHESFEKETKFPLRRMTSTLLCKTMKGNCIVQVNPDAINLVRSCNRQCLIGPLYGERSIISAGATYLQIIVALKDKTLIYFEMDDLYNFKPYRCRTIEAKVCCIEFPPPFEGGNASEYVAIGLENKTIHIMSLATAKLYAVLEFQVPYPLKSIILSTKDSTDKVKNMYTYDMLLGFENGLIAMGEITNFEIKAEFRFFNLDSKPVKMFHVPMSNKDSILMISSFSWLLYYHKKKLYLRRFAGREIKIACSNISNQWVNAFVAVSNILRIVIVEDFDGNLQQKSIPLEYTPRKVIIEPKSKNLFLIETDHNALTKETKEARRKEMDREIKESVGKTDKHLAVLMAKLYTDDKLCPNSAIASMAGLGMWASVIRIVNPVEMKEVFSLPLEQNLAAFSVDFFKQDDDMFLLIGAAKNVTLESMSSSDGIIQIYSILHNGSRLEFLSCTPIKGIPLAITSYASRILIGAGKCVHLFKFHSDNTLIQVNSIECVKNQVVTMCCAFNNVIVGDVMNKSAYLRFDGENELELYMHDSDLCWSTAACIVNSNFITKTDKYGNMFIYKVPLGYGSNDSERLKNINDLVERQWLSKYPPEALLIGRYYIGEMVLSMKRSSCYTDAPEGLLYATVSGSIGMMAWLPSEYEGKYFRFLEACIQRENEKLAGENHYKFRSHYYNMLNVIDGDLLEQFEYLNPKIQRTIAMEMETTPNMIRNKIMELRLRFVL